MKRSYIFIASMSLLIFGQSLNTGSYLDNANKKYYDEFGNKMYNIVLEDNKKGLTAEEEITNYKNILLYNLRYNEDDYEEDILKEIVTYENKDILFSIYLLDIHNAKVKQQKTNYYEDLKDVSDYNDILEYIISKEGNLSNFNFYLNKASML